MTEMFIPNCDYGTLWEALERMCAELSGRGASSRSQPMLTADGRQVSVILSLKQKDGSWLVHYLTARQDPPGERATLRMRTWIDNQDEFWGDLHRGDRRNSVVVDHRHYEIAPESDRGMRGFGGQRFRIRFLADGRVVESTNLWSQGLIPPAWRDRLPDNAEFLPVETPRVSFAGLDGSGD